MTFVCELKERTTSKEKTYCELQFSDLKFVDPASREREIAVSAILSAVK
jgi:hypothetical protein